ncbi:transglycosylase domain-containing protein [Gangjinia marincola]|uniref:Transglycosylase domain-containing protein n=1 Tax=Gangjinia marincola TaxID=578463 RepID=A0ABP3XT64_9FLAO
MRKKKKAASFSWFKLFLKLFLSVILLLFLFVGSIYVGLWGKLPSKEQLATLTQSKASIIFDRNKEVLGKVYVFDREPITYDQLPKHLIEALVSTEDTRYYEHNGVDEKSLLRVIFKTILLQQKSAGGGSTITQQLAKNAYGRKDFGRFGIVVNKIREIFIARRMEEVYSKEDILTKYLNTVPFPDNTYGIGSASRKFFNKKVSDLNLTEAATLIGSLKANYYYNPRLFPAQSKARRNTVLKQMVSYGTLSPDRAKIASLQPLVLDYQHLTDEQASAAYFREQVRLKAIKILDSIEKSTDQEYNLYHDGLKIYTTLDKTMQGIAEDVTKNHLAKLQGEFEQAYGNNAPWIVDKALRMKILKRSAVYKNLKNAGWNDTEIMDSLQQKRLMNLFSHQGDLVKEASIIDSIVDQAKLLHSGTLITDQFGAVRTWIGGVNFETFQYDHVAQSKRQVGSVFKPIVYTAALESGIDPCSYFPVRKYEYEEGWVPSNSSETKDPYLNISMKKALSRSVNTVAVQVFKETGLENVQELAYAMGIESTLPNVSSLALGTAELGILELSKAYSTYINKGKPATPYFIVRIETSDGTVLADFKPKTTKEEVISQTTRKVIIDMLQETVNKGTAKRLRTTYNLTNALAGKTGTTQNNKDAWFVGITPKLVAITWVGLDNYEIGFSSTAIGQGAYAALPVFGETYKELTQRKEYRSLTKVPFEQLTEKEQELVDCPDDKRDGLLKRLFTNPEKTKKYKKKKKGFLGLFGKKSEED